MERYLQQDTVFRKLRSAISFNRCLESPGLHTDDFVMGIRHYSSAVSDSSSPAGIMLFVDRGENIKPVLQVMEYAFPIDTVIVGNSDCHILHKRPSRNGTRQYTYGAAVALVFTKDKNKPVGELGDCILDPVLYIGVTKERCSTGMEKVRWLHFLEFHERR